MGVPAYDSLNHERADNPCRSILQILRSNHPHLGGINELKRKMHAALLGHVEDTPQKQPKASRLLLQPFVDWRTKSGGRGAVCVLRGPDPFRC